MAEETDAVEEDIDRALGEPRRLPIATPSSSWSFGVGLAGRARVRRPGFIDALEDA